jgi:hypothetical protein
MRTMVHAKGYVMHIYKFTMKRGVGIHQYIVRALNIEDAWIRIYIKYQFVTKENWVCEQLPDNLGVISDTIE